LILDIFHLTSRLENKIGIINVNTRLEAIITEYNPTLIKPLSNRIFITIMLVLNLTESPIPSKIDFFLPNSLFPTT